MTPATRRSAPRSRSPAPNVIAVTGGYYGDAPPYDGHVVAISRATGRIAHVWNSECSSRHQLIVPTSCSITSTRGGNAIWSRAGAVIEPGSGSHPGHDRQRPVRRPLDVGRQRARADPRREPPAAQLDTGQPAHAVHHRHRPRQRLARPAGDLPRAPARGPGRQAGRALAARSRPARRHAPRVRARRLGGQLQQIGAPGGQDVFTQPAVWHDGTRTLVFVGHQRGDRGLRAPAAGPGPGCTCCGRTARVRPARSSPAVCSMPMTSRTARCSSAGRSAARPCARCRRPPGHWNSPIVVGGRIIETTGDYHAGNGPSTLEIWHLPGR